jgi:hypothetical protein
MNVSCDFVVFRVYSHGVSVLRVPRAQRISWYELPFLVGVCIR